MEREIAFGVFQRRIDHGTGHAQSTVVPQHCTDRLTGFNAVGSGVFEANLFEDAINILDDGVEVMIAKRVVAAAAFAGPHRLHRVFQRRTALSMSRLSASRTSRHRQVPPKAGQRLPGTIVIRVEEHARNTAKTGAAPEKFGGVNGSLASLVAYRLYRLGITPETAQEIGMGDDIQRSAIEHDAGLT